MRLVRSIHVGSDKGCNPVLCSLCSCRQFSSRDEPLGTHPTVVDACLIAVIDVPWLILSQETGKDALDPLFSSLEVCILLLAMRLLKVDPKTLSELAEPSVGELEAGVQVHAPCHLL